MRYILIITFVFICTTLTFAQDNLSEFTFDEGFIAEWSPDGQQIAVSTDADLYMVDAMTQEVHHIVSYDNPPLADQPDKDNVRLSRNVENVYWSDDGQFIALTHTATQGGASVIVGYGVWIIDLQSQSILPDNDYYNNGIAEVAFAHDNLTALAYSCNEYSGGRAYSSCVGVIDWAGETNADLVTFGWIEATGNLLAWSRDNALIAIDVQGLVTIYDSKSGEEVLTILADTEDLGDLYWTEDNQYIVTYGERLRMWDVETGDAIFSIPIPQDTILNGVGFVLGDNLQSPTDTSVLVSRGITLYEVNVMTGHITAVYQSDALTPYEHEYDYTANFSPDGASVLVTTDSQLSIEPTIRTPLSPPQQPTITLADQAFAGHLYGELGWTSDGSLYAFNGRNLDIRDTLTKSLDISDGGVVNESALSTDMHYWAVSLWGEGVDRTVVYVFDTKRNTLVCQYNEHMGDITMLEFSPDNQQLVSGSTDTSLRLWDIATCEQVHVFWGQNAPVTDIEFTRDGRYLASTGFEFIHLWDTQTGDLEWRSYAFTEWVQDFEIGKLAFLLDGQYVTARVLKYDFYSDEPIYEDTFATIAGWDMSNPLDQREGRFFLPHVYAILISPDQRYIAETTHRLAVKLNTRIPPLGYGEAISISPYNCYGLFEDYYFPSVDDSADWITFSPDSSLFAFPIHQECYIEVPNTTPEEFDRYTIAIVDTATGEKKQHIFTENESHVLQLLFSPDGRQLVSQREDGTVHIIDVASGEIVMAYP